MAKRKNRAVTKSQQSLSQSSPPPPPPPREKSSYTARTLQSTSKHNDDDCVMDSCVLPVWTPLAVSLLTLAFRVYHVMDPSSWWVVHPDEVFQSMEVAHSELYGYGLRPYEFKPPAPNSDNLSHYELRELTLGMYALRSPIMPQYMVLVAWLTHMAGLDTGSPYLIFRLSHVAITSFLPVAAANFALAVCQNPDVAAVSAILTGASAYLNVMGTHTLVNSFVSPAIFLGLARVMQLVEYTYNSPTNATSSENVCEMTKIRETGVSEDNVVIGNGSNNTALKPHHIENVNKGHGNFKELSTEINDPFHSDSVFRPKANSSYCNNINKTSEENQRKSQLRYSLSDTGYESMDTRSNSRSSSSSSTGSRNFSDHGERFRPYKQENVTSNNGYDYQTIFYSLSGTNGADKRKCTKEAVFSSQKVSFSADVGFACLLALAIYIRPDTALFAVAVLLSRYQVIKPRSLLHNRRTWFLALGGVFGLSLGAADDVMFYGGPVLSPLNWFRFNVLNSMASELFGVSDAFFYLRRLFFRDLGMCLASSVLLLAIFLSLSFKNPKMFKQHDSTRETAKANERRKIRNSDNICVSSSTDVFKDKYQKEYSDSRHRDVRNKGFRAHTASIVLLIALYSCMGHKEERFLHDVIILFLVTVSEATFLVTDCVGTHFQRLTPLKRFSGFKRLNIVIRKPEYIVVVMFSMTFIVSQIQTFHSSTRAQTKEWFFSSPASGLDTNVCMHFLSKQADVSGVVIENNIDAGGYTMLHKNVPLIYLLGSDFVEFTESSLFTEDRPCILGGKSQGVAGDGAEEHGKTPDFKECRVGHFSITRVSDLIHKENSRALLEKLVKDRSPSLRNCQVHQTSVHHETTPDLRQAQQERCNQDENEAFYNYAIVQAGKQFLAPAFTLVYKTPSMWVWRRAGEPDTEAWLQSLVGATRGTKGTGVDVVPERSTGMSNEPEASTQLFSEGKQNTGGKTKAQTDGATKDTHSYTQTHSQIHKQLNNANFENKERGNDKNGKTISSSNSKNNASHSKKRTGSNNVHSSSGYILFGDAAPTGSANVAGVLEYEGEVLKQFGNYWQALRRFQALMLLTKGHDPPRNQVKVSVLASAAFCLHRMGKTRQMQRLLGECMTSYPRDPCLDGGRVRVLNLGGRTRA